MAPQPEIPVDAGLGNFVVRHTFIELAEDSQTSALPKRSSSAPPSLLVEDVNQELALGSAVQIQEDIPMYAIESCTTVNIRHLPHVFTREMLLELLDSEGFRGQYDFVYLPLHYRELLAYGNAIVNFINPKAAQKFYMQLQGYSFTGGKHAAVSWASSQGLSALVELYRNTPVMHEMVPDMCKPVVFQACDRVNFPMPTKKVPKPRSLRSNQESTPSEAGEEQSQCSSKQRHASRATRTSAAKPMSCPNSPLLSGGLEWVGDQSENPGGHRAKKQSSRRRLAEQSLAASPLLGGLEFVGKKEMRSNGAPGGNCGADLLGQVHRNVEAGWKSQLTPISSPLFHGLQQVDAKQSNPFGGLNAGCFQSLPWSAVEKAQAHWHDDTASTGVPSSSSLSSSMTDRDYTQAHHRYSRTPSPLWHA